MLLFFSVAVVAAASGGFVVDASVFVFVVKFSRLLMSLPLLLLICFSYMLGVNITLYIISIIYVDFVKSLFIFPRHVEQIVTVFK